MLPPPSDTIAAPRDLPTEESRFPTRGAVDEIFAVGAPYPEEVAISLRFLRILLSADLRAAVALSDSFAVFAFPTPTALEPPDVATFSTYCWHAEPQLPVSEVDIDAAATAGTASAATRKQATITLRQNKSGCSLSHPRTDTK